ncbi:MAG: tetratricopeptide repeat protein [Pyrinomonadaceae bacterium]
MVNRRKTFELASTTVRLLAALMLLASLASAHDGLHEQIAEVTARIKRAPLDATLYLKRGELYRLHQDWRRADADYTRAARLQPALAVVDLARGKMLFEAGRPQSAKVPLDRFLLKQPQDVEALVTRARVLVKLGRRTEAGQEFTTAISLTSTPQPELYIERARSLADDPGSNTSNTIEALRGIDEGLTKLGSLVTLQLYAVELELRRKNYDAALARLETVAAQSPRKETWLFSRGEILLLAGRKIAAHEAFVSALTALESLPKHSRRTRAIADLEARLRTALAP